MDTFNTNATIEEKTKEILLSCNYMSTRLFNCLKRDGYENLYEVVTADPDDLRQIRNFGRQSQDEVEELIAFVKVHNRSEILRRCYAAAGESNNEDNTIHSKQSMITKAYGRFVSNEEFVCIEKSGASVIDCLIERDDVSQRTYNVLIRMGIFSFRELAEKDYQELRDARGFGKLSISEMLTILKERTKIVSQCIVKVENPEKVNELVDKIEVFLSDCVEDGFDESIRSTLFNSVANHCIDSEGNIIFDEGKIREILHSEEVKNLVKTSIYSYAGDTVYAQVTCDDIKRKLYKFDKIESDYLAGILQEMIAAKMILGKNGYIFQYKIPLRDWILELRENERVAVSLRCTGCTLEEVGNELGVTRERARQIISKGLKRRPELFEDGYREIFEKYSFSDKEFEVLLGINYEVINYLKLVSGKRKEYHDVQYLISDGNLPQICRERAANAFKDSFLFVSGELLPLKREIVLEWVLKNYYSDSDCTINELESFYYDFLEENGVSNNERLKFPSHHAFEARLIDYMYCILKYGKHVRYYDIDALDMESLVKTLDFGRYDGTEISTLKIFVDNADYLEELDIRDEYELHNILRKKSAYLSPWNVTIARMPFVSIGQADRYKQVRELLYQMTPISKDDLAMEYEVRYGVKKETVLANFFGEIDVYLNNGIFDVAQPELSLSEFKQLGALLVDDIYMWGEIIGLYEKTIGGRNVEAVNAMTVKQLGFKVFSEYIIRNTYSSADSFFTEILTKNDQIDISMLKPGVRSVQAFHASLYHLRDELELIEIEKDHFVRFDYFSARIVSCTKDDLLDIGRSVLEHNNAEVFSIRNNEVNELVNRFACVINNIYFLNSIVRVQPNVKTNIIGGVCVVARNGRDASLIGTMMELLRNQRAYDVDELVDAVFDVFGITTDRYKAVYFLNQEKTVEVDSILGIIRLVDNKKTKISEKAFWIDTPYEDIITAVKNEIEESKATISGVYWKERYALFVEKCKGFNLNLMKELLNKDVETLCEKMKIPRTMIADIIQVYISWAKELREKKEEDTEDIFSLFFK